MAFNGVMFYIFRACRVESMLIAHEELAGLYAKKKVILAQARI